MAAVQCHAQNSVSSASKVHLLIVAQRFDRQRKLYLVYVRKLLIVPNHDLVCGVVRVFPSGDQKQYVGAAEHLDD